MLGRHKNARQSKMSYFYFSINEDGTNYTILASDLPAQSTNAALKTVCQMELKYPVTMQFYILQFDGMSSDWRQAWIIGKISDAN